MINVGIAYSYEMKSESAKEGSDWSFAITVIQHHTNAARAAMAQQHSLAQPRCPINIHQE